MADHIVHCWQDRAAWIEETFGFHSDEHIATYLDDFEDGTCMLEQHHDGPCEFTPDRSIVVRFADEQPGADAPESTESK